MIESINLPDDLSIIIGSENKDFAVKAKRAKPFRASFSYVIFGIVWTAFTSIFVFTFLGPVFKGEEVQFTTNGVATVAGPGNLGPLMGPAIFLGVFVLIGLSILGFGIYSLLKKGGYFVGTPTRLIQFQKGKTISTDWEQFSGNIELRGTNKKGNILLELRTGKMVSRKNSSPRYVPDVIYITGIPGAFEIEQLCRKRIKENDPTPPVR